jgi:hypothetical protein
MAERPDDDTIRLLREVLEEIGTNERVQAGGVLFGMTIRMEGGAFGMTVDEPPIRVLRHLLDLLRHLDMPSSDVRLDRVFPIVERMPIRDDWRTELEAAKAVYQKAQLVTNIRVQQPDEGVVDDPDSQATWIMPREAFGLWAYGGVIHHDYAKELKWARLGIAQSAIRQMGHDYAAMLLDEADFLFRLLRSHDPTGEPPPAETA